MTLIDELRATALDMTKRAKALPSLLDLPTERERFATVRLLRELRATAANLNAIVPKLARAASTLAAERARLAHVQAFTTAIEAELQHRDGVHDDENDRRIQQLLQSQEFLARGGSELSWLPVPLYELMVAAGLAPCAGDPWAEQRLGSVLQLEARVEAAQEALDTLVGQARSLLGSVPSAAPGGSSEVEDASEVVH